MLTEKPSIPTSETPNEIIGYDMLDAFTSHYVASTSGSGGPNDVAISEALEQYTRNKKEVPTLRKTIAGIYVKLRANGFYPDGMDDNGIRWRTALQDKVKAKVDAFEPFTEAIPPKPTDQQCDILRKKAMELFGGIGNV